MQGMPVLLPFCFRSITHEFCHSCLITRDCLRQRHWAVLPHQIKHIVHTLPKDTADDNDAVKPETVAIMGSSKPSKRPRLENDQQPEPARIRQQRAAFLASMSRSISPPVARRSSSISPLDADSLRFKSTDCAAHSVSHAVGLGEGSRSPFQSARW